MVAQIVQLNACLFSFAAQTTIQQHCQEFAPFGAHL